jgi:hypothetical protein
VWLCQRLCFLIFPSAVLWSYPDRRYQPKILVSSLALPIPSLKITILCLSMLKSVVAEGPSARPASSPSSTRLVHDQNRTLLSPLDAWHINNPYNIDRNHRADFNASTGRTVNGGDDGGSRRVGFVGMMVETSGSAFRPTLFRYALRYVS